MKYREKLIEIYKNPPNEGELKEGLTGRANNPGCGDRAKIYLKVEGSTITEAKHKSRSCVIATAAMDTLCEKIEGRTIDEALSIENDKLASELGVSVGPGREKCVKLPLNTLENAINQSVE